ncbi:ABC-F family ATP-binding cassette domain-containing protein [Rhodophyticola sp. CCM32]|uniref:ABC-F family ATP-binding cassette domain-containing protein n=1 Tax=Rhodophyticola sp. CCM32 TaxID=2916397 RepID=UPI00107F3482|nr:ABC-F family ATP-binding cassette domain-containing protein [Rhodophyticola sp. CCM32]QBY01511.1 ABC-F family ATP-binding cassette domain-containing protein [Rhodophyticola sp. CCM32]
MPCSIQLSNLFWSTPDGQPLFTDLTLQFGPGRTGLVGRNGVGKTTLLRLIEGKLTPQSGQITRDGPIAILRQEAQIPQGQTIADLFQVTDGLACLARAGAGRASADDLATADWTLPARIETALGRFGLDTGPETALSTLSGGQQTRARLAALIFADPAFLLLDEPTNTLDQDGRAAVIALLQGWQAGAIVVSHDRDLLDNMDRITELTSLGATSYGGNYSAYQAQKARELTAARQHLDRARRQIDETARKRQVTVERKARRDRAGRAKRAKGDMPKITANSARDRSERTTASLSRTGQKLHSEAETALRDATARVERLTELTVSLPETGLANGQTVLRAVGLTGGFDPARPLIRDLSLHITGPERVALTGANGAGKSTLLNLLTGRLQPVSGTVTILPDHAMLDQHVGLLDPALSLRDNFHLLTPDADDKTCRAALARFGFRAESALCPTATLSGGQMLRAGLACVLGAPRPPRLLILDEPTNHLDLEAIAAMEDGLTAYDGALLVVSHDHRFLRHIGITRHLTLPRQL